MNLFLYISIGQEPLFFPGNLLSELSRTVAGIQTLEIDEHASPELMGIAKRAVERADRIFLYCHRVEKSNSGILSGLFKSFVQQSIPTFWYHQGSLEGLTIFRTLFTGDFELHTTDTLLKEQVIEFFKAE